MKVSHSKKSPALKTRGEGRPGENPLRRTAGANPSTHSATFGSHLRRAAETTAIPKDEPENRKRAQRAVRTYRSICTSEGLEFCFFSNFAIWRDFILGKIGEVEFLARAKQEAEKIKNMQARPHLSG